ncbi:MAG: L-cysteine:1D-myo-inositol 2-amino-2-deoxy-alpha-D-glucopyranoside ligase, partial [Microbacteriaceae bacterium]|nr:L-cysteine:1D-myo-inositol 2-amino-2-deoxy-alpha-D-glucopyranoside ligase [Microbacteriaceae bacterium]
GEKMSKSLGNLVLVSRLVADGVDPRVIRLAILAEHYRSDWEWTDAHLEAAQARLTRWLDWAGTASGQDTSLLDSLRSTLSGDLDTPGAVRLIDDAVAASAETGAGAASGAASDTAVSAISALLGIDLRQ